MLCTAQTSQQLPKLPSGYRLDPSVLVSATRDIFSNGFNSLTTSFSHFSALCSFSAALALMATLLQHCTRQRPGRRKGRDANAFTSLCQTACLFLLGLAGGVRMLLCDLTSTPQIIDPAFPRRPETYHFLMLFLALSSRHGWGRRAAAARVASQAAAGLPVPGNACQVRGSWAPVIRQSCCFSAPHGLLTFHLD